ncbi:hypothetical protein FOS14_06460 [Skermania sp. ID1734]|uniref:hypothetical protein n=1 Tax=Skermania sp. ID1734 TaxID=2597516 RepID=UPI00117FB2C6|nr:hypothetical protein [Skermania sp. ID1734]TSE00668.1 hypothetical protein FOS14_06460 [Skermania sp. ID1734]
MIQDLPDTNVITTASTGNVALTLVLLDTDQLLPVMTFTDTFGSNYRIRLSVDDLDTLHQSLNQLAQLDADEYENIRDTLKRKRDQA